MTEKIIVSGAKTIMPLEMCRRAAEQESRRWQGDTLYVVGLLHSYSAYVQFEIDKTQTTRSHAAQLDEQFSVWAAALRGRVMLDSNWNQP